MEEINRFREAFFDSVIESEKKKEQEQKALQRKCFHHYSILDETYERRGIMYEARTCSKCGHAVVKRRGTASCLVS